MKAIKFVILMIGSIIRIPLLIAPALYIAYLNVETLPLLLMVIAPAIFQVSLLFLAYQEPPLLAKLKPILLTGQGVVFLSALSAVAMLVSHALRQGAGQLNLSILTIFIVMAIVLVIDGVCLLEIATTKVAIREGEL